MDNTLIKYVTHTINSREEPTTNISILKRNACNLKFVLFNINGINNQFNLETFETDLNISGDIIYFSETWVYWEDPILPEYLKANFSQIFVSRAVKQKQLGRASGGLLVLIKQNNNISVTLIDKSEV